MARYDNKAAELDLVASEQVVGRYDDDEIDLMELFQTLWQQKWLIAGTTLLLGLAVAIYSLTLPNTYKAEASLIPVASGGGGLGQYAGLASLAGVSLPKGEASKSQEALAVLQSRAFLSRFIATHDLKPWLFEQSWDLETQSWLESKPSMLSELKGLVLGGSDSSATGRDEGLLPGEPTMQQAVKRLRDMISVNENRNNNLVTLAIEHTDAELASRWVNQLVTAVNEHMRQQEVDSAQRSIAFLERQLNQISLVEHRQVAFRIIEENLKSLTLAQTEADFVFRTIDPAVVPEQKSGPKRSLMVAVGLVLGFMLGVFYALVASAVRKRRESTSNPG
ncbi:Wzz/FepE/Etk N-terminal domain-containing protein [Thiomicrospira sp. R3]|uniref:Wzz/FepE/Etk N-terminal domain-containing protein n=1 Tax=Thiomicrospira sp. R3 TaxID=3035472 RepID=UPI00259BF01E|nr:Wzz/FepE/Etk N-terminal domain-containing protein [Thiomicrospira sp. R3]WFE68777.1 Wzz/FepE/Etk N-terminal domain-containing protein [Thiomicrospira sp. R3]